MARLMSLIAAILSMASDPAMARNVYVNGVDISSARNQLMENVTVRIDQDGNVFVEAPHYQVNEESTYVPLRRHGIERPPAHKPGGPLPPELSKAGSEQPFENEAPPPGAGTRGAQPAASLIPQLTEGKQSALTSPPETEQLPPAQEPPLVGKEGTKAPVR